MSKRIALVTNVVNGGLWSSTLFLSKVINTHPAFQSEIISLAHSSRDSASVRLIKPQTWFQSPAIQHKSIRGQDYTHVGSILTEFEFQRYQPRQALTTLLDKYDLIQIIGGGPALACVAKQVKKPVLLQVQTLVSVERRKSFQQSARVKRHQLQLMSHIVSKIEQHSIHIPKFVFVNNEWMFEWVSTRIGKERTIFAPLGIDTNFFIPAYQRKSEDQSYILAVGRFADPRKNIRFLFDAYALLQKTASTTPKLMLAGRTAPTEAALFYADQLGILDSLIIHKDISQEKLRELYQNAAIFVLPSDEEGFGIVIVEAMASGLPVVSTDCGGPSSIILHEETGLLTEVGNVQAFAEAINRILSNTHMHKQMGKAGRKRAVSKFSHTIAAQKYLTIYEKLLGDKN